MTGCVDEQREWVEDLYLTQSAVEHGQSVNSAQLEKRLGKPDAVLSLRQFSDAVPQNQPRRKVIINDVQKCAKKHDDKVVWVYDESGRYSKPLPFPVLFGQDTEFHAAIFTILRNDEVSGGFIVENWKGLKK
ncbi:MAG TPA: hypothetical protein PKK48_06185 [Phycisphaerae bacterium]|nr:hypothetical protein [Phycisphaerae bacterium]HPS51955.1 hypothetical protein [Phycisphaerae bacterium]